MKRKRATEVFSLSFLDVICCGFGAIILLFVITMGKKTKEVTNLRIALERIIQQRMLQLNEYEIVTDEISTFILMEESKIKDKKIVEEDLDAIIAKQAAAARSSSSGAASALLRWPGTRRPMKSRKRFASLRARTTKP
jgi:hypothetical protein